jgi:hypothetical protein
MRSGSFTWSTKNIAIIPNSGTHCLQECRSTTSAEKRHRQKSKPTKGAKLMIELNEFEISTVEYMKLFDSMQPRYEECWAYAYILVIVTSLSIFIGGLAFPLVISFGTFLLLMILLQWLFGKYINNWAYALFLNADHVVQIRKMTFDTDKIHVLSDEGSFSHLFNRIRRATRSGDYYLLFLSSFTKNAFIPVPVSAFRSDEDRMQFETEILGSKLKTKTFPWKKPAIFILISACLLGATSLYSRHDWAHELEIFVIYWTNF